MTTRIGMVLCILAAAALACEALRAGQPEPTPTTGKVLVLDNERTLAGDIERVGEQYRIRRSVGELWVPLENTLRLCENPEEAYAFLRGRANLRDPDERLRLARWCYLQGLRRQALEEATAAVELRPNHAESRRLLRSLQRASDTSFRQSEAPEETNLPSKAQSPELSTESLSLFLTRVQPILMNACAHCHATGRGGAFKLVRTYELGMAGRKTTQQNLAAVLAQVNSEQPTASPLLSKAVSVHGKPGEMTQSPLKNREVAAYRSLEEWVRLTFHDKTPVPNKPSLVTERVGTGQAIVTGETAVPPEPVADAVDPFDPVVFNRQMRPKK